MNAANVLALRQARGVVNRAAARVGLHPDQFVANIRAWMPARVEAAERELEAEGNENVLFTASSDAHPDVDEDGVPIFSEFRVVNLVAGTAADRFPRRTDVDPDVYGWRNLGDGSYIRTNGDRLFVHACFADGRPCSRSFTLFLREELKKLTMNRVGAKS